jgi:predicted site-specific integrase-resolvase
MPARNLKPMINTKDRGARQPMGAVVYARVPSKDQEKEGFSIPAQQRLLREYAIKRGFTVVREFVDVGTAKQAGRPEFAAMRDSRRRNSRGDRGILRRQASQSDGYVSLQSA